MEEYRLRVLVNRMLRKMVGPKMEDNRNNRRLEKMAG
jgi:hypothetical protein